MTQWQNVMEKLHRSGAIVEPRHYIQKGNRFYLNLGFLANRLNRLEPFTLMEDFWGEYPRSGEKACIYRGQRREAKRYFYSKSEKLPATAVERAQLAWKTWVAAPFAYACLIDPTYISAKRVHREELDHLGLTVLPPWGENLAMEIQREKGIGYIVSNRGEEGVLLYDGRKIRFIDQNTQDDYWMEKWVEDTLVMRGNKLMTVLVSRQY